MNHKKTRFFLGALIAALMLSAVLAGSAGAAPAWKFNGKTLEGSEKIVGGAEKSGLTVPGMTTTCANFLYGITISNVSGTGKGSLTELPLFECSTNTVCTVESTEAEGLPWPATLKTVGTTNYIIIEKVHENILYGNPKCAVYETEVEIEGTAGGSIDNTTERATFSPTTFTATGTSLKSAGNKVEWNGVFPTEAFEWHRNEALTAS